MDSRNKDFQETLKGEFEKHEFDAFLEYILLIRAKEEQKNKGGEIHKFYMNNPHVLALEDLTKTEIENEDLFSFLNEGSHYKWLDVKSKARYHLANLIEGRIKRINKKRHNQYINWIKKKESPSWLDITNILYQRKKQRDRKKRNKKMSFDYFQVYLDFIGVKDKEEFLYKATALGLLSEKHTNTLEQKTEFIFRGYYLYEYKQLNTLLIGIDFTKKEGEDSSVRIFEETSDKAQERHKQWGDYRKGSDTCICLTTQSEDKSGFVEMIIYTGHGQESRLKNEELLFFGTYASINSSGKPSCGMIIIHKVESEKEAWESSINPDIVFYLETKGIRYLLKDRPLKLNGGIKKEYGQERSYWKKEKALISEDFSGVFEGYSVISHKKLIVKQYLHIDRSGAATFKSTHAEEYEGQAKITGDEICLIHFKKMHGDFFLFLKKNRINKLILYGTYKGVQGEIIGGRILFIRKSIGFENLKPHDIPFYSQEYKSLQYNKLTQEVISYLSSNPSPQFDDITLFTEPKFQPLPLPKINPDFILEGISILYLLSPDEKKTIIREVPIEIDSHGYLDSKTLFSSNHETDHYEGRAYVQDKRLYIYLYYENQTKFQGLLTFLIEDDSDYYLGTYSSKNLNGVPVCGRCAMVFAIEKSSFKLLKPKDIHLDDDIFRRLNREYNGLATKLMNQNVVHAINISVDLEKANLYFQSASYLALKGNNREAEKNFIKAIEYGFNNETVLEKELDRENGCFKNMVERIERLKSIYMR